jgi:hypothetical protein
MPAPISPNWRPSPARVRREMSHSSRLAGSGRRLLSYNTRMDEKPPERSQFSGGFRWWFVLLALVLGFVIGSRYSEPALRSENDDLRRENGKLQLKIDKYFEDKPPRKYVPF